ncbi:hypothetical protein [Xylanimonas protaetiae]|uniref:Uncharacterized protein n=1 Tax=Xylanimonas protaetiae TaxID=2509457 RepID=A0A4P6F382_9MICO|nr:hypothetical protein [Xylanimonas protaetiae]QAY69736.1 hypothetical protein ET471_06520 [Xylanimonas protaetiae]
MSTTRWGNEPDATMRELLEIVGDIVNWVDGRVEAVHISLTALSFHVTTQADAEYLARRLRLGHVSDFPSTFERGAFTLWWGAEWPCPLFQVFCGGEMVRPVRAFPDSDARVIEGELVGSEAA